MGSVDNKKIALGKISVLCDDFKKSSSEIIDDLIQTTYNTGFAEGEKSGYSDAMNENAEKVGVTFVVEKFADCKTVADFQDVFKECERLNLNHTKPIGLKTPSGQRRTV